MPVHLQTFGAHYEVWRLDDGRLCVNVIHGNKGELRQQQGYPPQHWWSRYGHQDPNHGTMAIRHAGHLVRAYQAEFQNGRVRFCFVALGEPDCEAQVSAGAAPQEQATHPKNPGSTPEVGSLRVPRRGGETHNFNRMAFQRWLQQHCAASEGNAIPLFITNNLSVRVNGNRVPERNSEMQRFYSDLIEDVRNGSVFCGIIYCMYWIRNSEIVPLYIGKTERYGRNGNISTNLNPGAAGPFGRWGYGNDYHMGDLGAGLRGEDRYQDWVEKLFKSRADLKLWARVFFGATAWTHYDRCSCGQRVNVAALETCLIRHAREFFPGNNLNGRDGDPDCRCP